MVVVPLSSSAAAAMGLAPAQIGAIGRVPGAARLPEVAGGAEATSGAGVAFACNRRLRSSVYLTNKSLGPILSKRYYLIDSDSKNIRLGKCHRTPCGVKASFTQRAVAFHNDFLPFGGI